MKKLPILLQLGAAMCLSNALAARPNPDGETINMEEPGEASQEQRVKVIVTSDAAATEAPDEPDAPGLPDKPDGPGDLKTRKEVREVRIQPRAAQSGGIGGLPGSNPFAPMTADRLNTIIKRSPGAAKPLVVRTSEADAKEEANLEEDMGVMSHLLEKAVGSSGMAASHNSMAMGVDLYFRPASGGMRSIYLEGYGAVFTLSVPFPLQPSGKGQTEKDKTSGDSEWEAAKQEVLGQGGEDRLVTPMGEEYDEQKVNKLKDSLLEALKNASNIRGIKSDELITVCVTGGPGNGQRVHTTRRPSSNGKGEEVIVRKESGGAGQRSMLSIRVRKGDADAFAKDKMSLEDFRKKARITNYMAGASEGSAGGVMNFGTGGGFGGGGGNNFNYEIITR